MLVSPGGGNFAGRVCSCRSFRPFLDSVEIHREVTSGDDARGKRVDDLKLAGAPLDQVISLPGEGLPGPNFPNSVYHIGWPPPFTAGCRSFDTHRFFSSGVDAATFIMTSSVHRPYAAVPITRSVVPGRGRSDIDASEPTA
jgi:hypothetical protein